MAEKKKPQDHLEKVEKPSVNTTEAAWVITHKGITVMVEKDALNDFELLDDLAALQADEKANAFRMPGLLRRLAGDEGYKAITDGLRGANGRVPIPETVQFVFEMFQVINPNS